MRTWPGVDVTLTVLAICGYGSNLDPVTFTLYSNLHKSPPHKFIFDWSHSFICLFVCLFVLRLNVPVNNFSVMSGRSQRFLGSTSTVGS